MTLDKHENVVKLQEFLEDEENFYIIMELCKCNLLDMLEKKKNEGFDELIVLIYMH